MEDFKDALLVYTQVEFLRNEMTEKNIIIKALINKDSGENGNVTVALKDTRSTVEQILAGEHVFIVNDDDDIETSDNYFINLYSQYVRDMKEMEEIKILEQLNSCSQTY